MTFGLVHGGAHGAWCWERLLDALDRLGHRGVAMDLPCEDDDAGAGEYAAVVLDALSAVNGEVVLVGHSLGGLTVPLVATARPASALIFLSGLLPVPGKSLRNQQADEPEMMFPYRGGRAGLRDRFYNTCPPEDADRAMTLLRTQALKPFVETTPLVEWPSLPVSYVLGTEDRACNPAWSRRAARERLGVEPVELAGADHSPFLSRPDELARLLVDLAGGGGVKVYEALARAFAAEGTTAVFDMMGDANMYWLNALDRLGVGIYDVRHEGAGLAMADGWARVTGAPGVCSTTSGPGTTQLATTMVVAARARTPLVAFCGDTATTGYDAQHFDQERFAAAVEAGFVRLDTPDDAYASVERAFTLARRESRPVMFSVATDLQQEPFDGETEYTPSTGAPLPVPDEARLEQAADILAASERVVLLVGRGAMQSGAGDAVLRLGDRIGGLLATSLLAKNWLNDAGFHAGICGGYGTRTSRELIRQADCVLVAGASVSHYTSEGGELLRNARVVQVDTRPDLVMGDGQIADCFVHGDARLALEGLDRILEERGFQAAGFRTPEVAERLATALDDPATFELEPWTVDPREVCAVLDELIPGEFGLVLGSGQQIRFGTMLLQRQRPFIVPQHQFGCIGQGLTTAMGAVIATGTPAFLLEGDGGLMMHLAEFETAVRYRLPLLVVVMNDEALGAEFHKSVAIGLDAGLTTISTPDLGAVGTALGGRGALVRSIDELRAAAAEFVAEPGPTLVDVRISRNVLSIPYRRMFYGEDV